MDEKNYSNWLMGKEFENESLCRNCGACCGAFEDPCEELVITPEGKSHCRVYTNRFGPHRSMAGKTFNCVPLRTKIGTSWPGDERCGYKSKH